jgi:hypothetical protein
MNSHYLPFAVSACFIYGIPVYFIFIKCITVIMWVPGTVPTVPVNPPYCDTLTLNLLVRNVADPDAGSGAFLIPGSGMN